MKCRASLIKFSTKILKKLVTSLIKLKEIISLRILIIKNTLKILIQVFFYVTSHKIVQNYLRSIIDCVTWKNSWYIRMN